MKDNSNNIHPDTINAVKILVTLFTQEQRDTLEINLNGNRITLVEQLISRWWSYIPVAENPLVFKTTAAKIIETNKNWVKFIDKLKQNDIFSQLLDPDNYKERTVKFNSFKMTDRRQIDSDQEAGNIMKSLATTRGGTGGLNKTYDYDTTWEREEREKLDKVFLERGDKALLKTETGEEDDTHEKEETKWLDKKERLETVVPVRLKARSPTAKFDKEITDNGEKILLFDASVTHSSNVTASESSGSFNTFIDGIRRQNNTTTKETIILAEAINNLHNIDFMDIREKIYKKFDVLFIHRRKRCL